MQDYKKICRAGLKEEKATSTRPEDKAKLQSNSNFNRPEHLLSEEEMAGIVKSSQNLECCFSSKFQTKICELPKACAKYMYQTFFQ